MNDREIMKMVEDRVSELEAVRKDLSALSADNPEIFEKFSEMTEMYNNIWDSIKNLLKEVTTSDAVRIGPFSRDRKKTTTKYKPQLLPDNVLCTPGVVKDVDDKKIAELVACGVIKQDDVEGAVYAYSRAPSVRSEVKRATLPSLVTAK